MNTSPWVASLLFSTLLFALPYQGAAAAELQPASSPTAKAATRASQPVSTAPVTKARKAKPSRRLSKATRSALQPLAGPAALALPPPRSAEGNLAAAMGRDTSNGLRETVEPPVAAGSARPFSVTLKPDADLTADDVVLASDEAAAEPGTEAQAGAPLADALGAESVSVIDRFSNKPRAKAITNGPLRLRLHDKALRASVQIPLPDGQ